MRPAPRSGNESLELQRRKPSNVRAPCGMTGTSSTWTDGFRLTFRSSSPKIVRLEGRRRQPAEAEGRRRPYSLRSGWRCVVPARGGCDGPNPKAIEAFDRGLVGGDVGGGRGVAGGRGVGAVGRDGGRRRRRPRRGERRGEWRGARSGQGSRRAWPGGGRAVHVPGLLELPARR